MGEIKEGQKKERLNLQVGSCSSKELHETVQINIASQELYPDSDIWHYSRHKNFPDGFCPVI